MPKTIKEHFTLAELVKTIIIVSSTFGLTAVSSDAPAINERVVVLETRIDPIAESLNEINKQLARIQKTQDSTNVIIMMHINSDKDK